MLLLRQPQQGGAEERPGFQVEGAAGVLGHAALQLRRALPGGEAGQVFPREVEGAPGEHHLHRLLVLHREDGAQHLVPEDDLPQAPGQRVRVERPLQAERGGNVVEGVPGLHPVHEPEALLGKGEREDEDFLVLRVQQGGASLDRVHGRVHLGPGLTSG